MHDKLKNDILIYVFEFVIEAFTSLTESWIWNTICKVYIRQLWCVCNQQLVTMTNVSDLQFDILRFGT